MKHQFSSIFHTALNALLDISNDDLPVLPQTECSAAQMAIFTEQWLDDLEKDCPFEKGMTVFYNGTACTSMLRIIEDPKFVKGEWVALCIHPYAERPVELPCNFMTRIVYRDQIALLDNVKVMRGGRS